MENLISEQSAAAGIFLDSWSFLAFVIVGILACRLINSPALRAVALFVINVYFFSYFINGLYPAAVVIALLLGVYLIGRLKCRIGLSADQAVTLSSVIFVWALLFLIKDASLLPALNPFSHYPLQILGLSYIIFRCISYLIEVESDDPRGIVDFVNFVIFFPLIWAGPIERYRKFGSEPSVGTADVDVGAQLHRIANGFIKKFILADNLMTFSVFSLGDPTQTATALIWLCALGQLFFIYLDFSGYCDIVIGVARLLGFRIRENFNKPFLSTNIQEFWERWHISLGSLMRDFVFNPMSKVIVKHAPRKRQFALVSATYFFVMILVALWHGTTIGFLVFGCVHGAALIFYQYSRPLRRKWSPFQACLGAQAGAFAARWSARALVYSFVSLSLILWMAEPGDVVRITRAMAGY